MWWGGIGDPKWGICARGGGGGEYVTSIVSLEVVIRYTEGMPLWRAAGVIIDGS
jgi:hypothetical protein